MNASLLCQSFCCLCLPVLFYGGQLAAQGLEVEMRHIQALAEAGDDERALRLYESVLEDVNGWQKAVVQYNIGTVWLAAGKPEKALESFRAISAGDVDLPLLRQRLDANSALAQLMLAENQWRDVQAQPDSGAAGYIQAVISLREALESIATAARSACALSHAEGSATCEPLPEIEEMHGVAKHTLSDLLEAYFNYKLAHVTVQGGTAGLLIGLEAVLANLAFLQALPDGEPLKPQYVDLAVKQAESWRPLWRALQNALQGSAQEPARQKLLESTFHRASEAFLAGLHLLQQGSAAASQKSFVDSKAMVDELMSQVFGQSNLKESLQQLLTLYDLALLQEPLQQLGVDVLAKAQKQLQTSVDKQGSDLLKQQYAAASTDLDAARQAVETLQLMQGRMFLLAANSAIKSIARELGPASANTPLVRLEDMIEAEKVALQVNLLRQYAQGRESLLEGSRELVLRVQRQALPLVGQFFEQAIDWQTADFRAPLSTGAADERCQTSPWETVIPLVVQGQHEASQALADLEGNPPQSGGAAERQAAAIKKWQAALMHLKEPKKQKKAQKQEDNKPQKEEKKQHGGGVEEQPPVPEQRGAAPAQAAGREDVNSVLRFLQEMENDDRSKPETVPQNGGRGGQAGAGQEARPW